MTKFFSISRLLVGWYPLKSEINRLLLLSVVFSTCLLAARIFYTGSFHFITLEWNLFLAFIPYAITEWVTNTPSVQHSRWKLLVLFICWILFIPNSFYILTDLFHLQESSSVPLWFNLLLILSFAWNGLLMGLLSVRQAEKIMVTLYGMKHELYFIYPIMFLNALGIFIGRYWRYNSWDIIANPFQLMIDSLNLLIHPIRFSHSWGMIFCYSVFMTLLYLTIKRISKLVW